MQAPRRWDLFCRVIDNFGDLGVAWRLAADLAGRGQPVRLWVDDARALSWMAPGGAAGVALRPFADTGEAPGDVVVELFGCDPPAPFVARMSGRARRPLWLNLEYLSAEAWVERSHGLPSPVGHGPGRGLTKWFYFPGFTERTGGLIREPGLLEQAADPAPSSGRPAASVFCYDNPALPQLAACYAGDLLLAPGPAQARPGLPGRRLPWLTQPGYDRLLRRCDLNFVRGEDSLVRAIWAGRPFVWQAYPQHDGVHRRKVDALLARLLEGAEDGLAQDLRRLWYAWNGFGAWPDRWPDARAWRERCRSWRDALGRQTDLVTRLLRFVDGHC
jgi:hypothetical protein